MIPLTNNTVHSRNKSLNDNDFISESSPFSNISRQKSWSSTNNLSGYDLSNNFNNNNANLFEMEILSPGKSILSKRIPSKSKDHICINIEDIPEELNIDEEVKGDDELNMEELETTSDSKKKSIFNDANLYITNLGGYFYYLIMNTIIIIIINSITKEPEIFPIDSIFFVYLSPIFYKLGFRQIFFYSLKNEKIIIKFFYPIAVLLGYCIRFLDYIPFFQKFVLNTELFVNKSEYIALFCVLIFYVFLIFFNELYKSTYRKINFCFLLVGGLFIYFTISFQFKYSYILHVHHYFIGLLFHIVCQTKKSKISIINNGIGLGIFLEGISKWGFSNLYYRIPVASP